MPDLKTFAKLCKWLARDPREFLGIEVAEATPNRPRAAPSAEWEGDTLVIRIPFRFELASHRAPGMAARVQPVYDVYEDHAFLSLLTERERRVFEGLVKGLANKEIANIMNLSERTVKFHVTQLLRKGNCRGRVDLVARYAPRELPPA